MRNDEALATILLLTMTFAAVPIAAAGERSTDGVWTQLTAFELTDRNTSLNPWIQPTRFQAVQLAAQPLSSILSNAPMEFTDSEGSRQTLLTLPTPDGQFETFRMTESPVMAPELQQWMADQGWPMRTYSGVSLNHPATSVRLDWGGPAGFHASVLSPQRNYFIDPYWQGDTEHYTSYFRSEYIREDHDFDCLVEGETETWSPEKSGTTTGGNLRTYRLAVAATGEYTAFHGGSVALGQAAIVTTIARVNQIYENDLSIRMVLVGNNTSVVFTDSLTDPYTNSNGVAMLGQNQIECDSTIGTANYDIGHVVSTGGGGVASLRVPCVAGAKARGVTGSGSPMGDPFDIDYVAHEMGHQWGGNHTFNSEISSCGGGNRNAGTAYEPGSGSTVQAYAGICGTDNLQSNSDAYFHGISLDEILNWSGGGGACSVNIPGVNPNAPTVTAGSAQTIPISTKFELTVASSGDSDGDSLTYTWEEFDLGDPTTLADPDNGYSPIFRSWSPSTATSQTFPNNGVSMAIGEKLPTTNRAMSFRVTARDNRTGGGRVGEDLITVTSTTSAGPFLVTSPNGGESWNGSDTVTWDVAGTSGSPVNATSVDIYLSIDGGATWPTTLVAGTPNDGTQVVTLPAVDTNTARIKIVASGNIFYDTSDSNFSIGTVVSTILFDQSTTCATGGATSQYFTDFAGGSDAADDFTVPAGQQWTVNAVSTTGSFSATFDPMTSANVYIWSDSGGLPGAVVTGCSFPSQAPAGGLSDPNISVDLPGTCVLDPGTYWLQVQSVMAFNSPTNSQWFWKKNTGPYGSEFAFRDLNDLFGTGCTVWSTHSGCLTLSDPDLCFTISGSDGSSSDAIFADGFESGGTALWSSVYPFP